jgi:hypothetical protein
MEDNEITYSLEIEREKGFTVYPMGTPVLSIRTNNLKGIRIYRYTTVALDITRVFLRFQRICRERIYVKKHAVQWIRKRELGKVVHDLVTLYRLRSWPALRRFD